MKLTPHVVMEVLEVIPPAAGGSSGSTVSLQPRAVGLLPPHLLSWYRHVSSPVWWLQWVSVCLLLGFQSVCVPSQVSTLLPCHSEAFLSHKLPCSTSLLIVISQHHKAGLCPPRSVRWDSMVLLHLIHRYLWTAGWLHLKNRSIALDRRANTVTPH